MVDKAKDLAKNVGTQMADKVKAVTGSGSAAAKAAAPLQWYQPSPGAKALGRAAATAGEAAPKLLAPVAALGGTVSAVEGIRKQAGREVEDIEGRGGWLASTMKDSFENLSAAGEKLGNDVGRVVTAAGGGVNPDSGERESVWQALTTTGGAGQGKNFAEIKKGYGDTSVAAPTAQAAQAGPPPLEGPPRPAPEAPVNPNKDPRQTAWEQKSALYRAASPDVRAAVDMGADINTVQNQGGVFTGRDRNGQLVVTSGNGRSDADNEALRAKEAARMQADTARQVDTFGRLRMESDLKSNDQRDVARGLRAMSVRQMEAAKALTERGQDITAENNRRTTDVAKYGHELGYEGQLATANARNAQVNAQLNAEQRKARSEAVGKYIEGQLGPTHYKDGKENPDRIKFERNLTHTLGKYGLTTADLNNRALEEFQSVMEMSEDAQPGAIEKLYMNWIDGNPYRENRDPYENVLRKQGLAGQTGSLNHYRNRQNVITSENDAVGRQFMSGTYDPNKKQIIDRLQ